MADAAAHYPVEFLAAVARVLRDEGGYVNNPDDPGGETNYGISKRSYPDLDIAHLTREQAIEIYFRDWWRKFRFGELPSGIAAKAFDLAVNMGAGAAVRCLQRALRACGRLVAEDGVIGDATIVAALDCAPAALMAALRSEAAGYYRALATAARLEGRNDEFLRGWLNRAYE
ncbi:peptidoglycan-binding protein [bacterium]|nr:peptidoglycan-binding protein [bacterium]